MISQQESPLEDFGISGNLAQMYSLLGSTAITLMSSEHTEQFIASVGPLTLQLLLLELHPVVD